MDKREQNVSENIVISRLADTIDHLGLLKKGECATITGLTTVLGHEQIAMRMRLLELGFTPGEQIRVVAESFPRRDPIAVRVGSSTFALRRREASMIQIRRIDAF
ncbi:MAG: FeoA family protein [Burkholderiaceae bacterium]